MPRELVGAPERPNLRASLSRTSKVHCGADRRISRPWPWYRHQAPGSDPARRPCVRARDVRGADRAGAVILDRAAGPVMTRPVPPELPEREPAGEITVEEQQEYARELLEAARRELAELDRPHRKRRLRAGTGQAAKPGGVGAVCRRPEAEARAGRQLGPARPGARSAVPTTASAAVLPGGLAPYGLPGDQALGIV